MSTQQTLTLDDADMDRQKPDTFRWCHDCEEFVLRSRWQPHNEHDWDAQQKKPEDQKLSIEDTDGEDNEPEKLGAWYDITLSYSVDYRFKIPAWSEHEAEEIAKEMKHDSYAADSHHVHTEKREVKEIHADDGAVPDDYDPYGSERLIDAIERKEEETEE